MRSIAYRPEIDGLRAIAVLGVIVFHFYPHALPSGFMGVDIFFVISGYLITSIILRQKEGGNFRLSQFWARRVRRILPALSAMVVISLLFVLALGLPVLINDSGKQAVATTACASNYRMLTLMSDYWSPLADRVLLLHTWSLAVEEQFYFFYPLMFTLGLVLFGKRFIRPAFILVATLSLAWCWWQTADAPAKAFFLMPARAWELLAGALIVASEPDFSKLTPRLRQAMAWAGAALILGSMFSPGKWASFPWPLALLPVLGTVLFIAFGDTQSRPGRLLSHAGVVGVGKASYSLYLWHWPCLVLGGLLASAAERPYLRDSSLIVGIGLGVLSWRWVEPLGRRENYVKCLAPVSFACMAGLAFFSAYKAPSYGPNDYVSEGWKGETYDARLLPKIGGVALGAGKNSDRQADIILLGDSHALSLASALDAKMAELNLSGFVFASGGARLVSWNPNRYEMTPDERRAFEDVRRTALLKHKPHVIILSARWETFDTADGLSAVASYVDHLRSICPESNILLVGQPPRLGQGRVKLNQWLNLRRRLGLEDNSIAIGSDDSAYKIANDFLRKFAESRLGVTYLGPDHMFPVRDGRVDVMLNNRLLYEDDDHLAQAGAEVVVSNVLELLKK